MRVLQERDFSGVFQVSNAAAGMDPAPGVVKSLRLQITAENAASRQLEFKENTVFRL